MDGGKRDDSGGEKDHRVHQVLEGGQTVAEMAGGGEERGQPLQGIGGRREGLEEGVETQFVIFQLETILGVKRTREDDAEAIDERSHFVVLRLATRLQLAVQLLNVRDPLRVGERRFFLVGETLVVT